MKRSFQRTERRWGADDGAAKNGDSLRVSRRASARCPHGRTRETRGLSPLFAGNDAMKFDIAHPDVRRAVEAALAEDVGAGDLTTDSTIPAELQAEARFVAREPMTVAGVELLSLLFAGPVLGAASGVRLKP